MQPNYEGYERLDSFTPEQLEKYRTMLLEKTKPQVEFIRKHIPDPPFDVIEIGCGNGRLLIGLDQLGLLCSGLGLDTSESRIEFARQWSRDLNARSMDYIHEDILDAHPYNSYFDLAVCITGCFQYFYPISPEAPRQVLNWMRNSATYSLFELYKRPPMGKTWKKLPDGDRWAYILDEYVDNSDWVEHTKVFIDHDGKEDVRHENLAYYTMPAFLSHLERAGYRDLHWAKENEESMVILAS
jgi:SAM-dependent methyltransferase